MTLCSLRFMVLGKRIEASYMIVSDLGSGLERNGSEEVKYDSPVKYTRIPHVPLWDQAGCREFGSKSFGFFRCLSFYACTLYEHK